jgi:hypothetical protein
VSAPGEKFDGDEQSGATSSSDESERSAADLPLVERGDGGGGGEHGHGNCDEQRTRGERRAGGHRPGGAEHGVEANRDERRHGRIELNERTPVKTAPEPCHDQHERKEQQQERRKPGGGGRQKRHKEEQDGMSGPPRAVGVHSASRHSTSPPDLRFVGF